MVKSKQRTLGRLIDAIKDGYVLDAARTVAER
jgi:hypothetical protein